MHHVAIVGVNDLDEGAVRGNEDGLAVWTELEACPFDVLVAHVFGNFEVRKRALEQNKLTST